MPCFHPITAYKTVCGSVVFSELQRHDVVSTLSLPCGRCAGCRLERSRQWALRCMHEASLYEENCFITLTYNEMHLPSDWSLDYRHFQSFMRNLRGIAFPREVRFYMCGEYGEVCKVCRKSVEFCKCASFVKDLGRPHFHAAIFNYDFHDKVYHSKSPAGSRLYRSKVLEGLWQYGYSSVTALNFDGAAYIARYIMKKITGDDAVTHYEYINPVTGEVSQRVPEFNRMSLKPGIGARWIDRYERDVYPSGKVVVRGVECVAPRYYDKRQRKRQPEEMDMLAAERDGKMRERYFDNTEERLLVKEKVQGARASMLKRRVN